MCIFTLGQPVTDKVSATVEERGAITGPDWPLCKKALQLEYQHRVEIVQAAAGVAYALESGSVRYLITPSVTCTRAYEYLLSPCWTYSMPTG